MDENIHPINLEGSIIITKNIKGPMILADLKKSSDVLWVSK